MSASGFVPAVSEQFGKSTASPYGKALLVSSVLPAALFVLFWQLLIAPLLPPTLPLLRRLEVFGPEWRVVSLVLVALGLALLLHVLNPVLTQLYEGYPWKGGPVGRFLTRRWQEEFDEANARVHGMHALLNAVNEKSYRYAEVSQHWNRMRLYLQQNFPGDRDLVLPTHLGNVIRGIEYYPYDRYRIDSINAWPRLITVVDEHYLQMVADAKMSFDFALNSSALSATFAACACVMGMLFASPDQLVRLMLVGLALSLLAFIFYRLAIGRAAAWGHLITGAFDIYRWPLLEKLGFRSRPRDLQSERALWEHICLHMAFGDEIAGPDKRTTEMVYEEAPDPSTVAVAAGDRGLILPLARGIRSENGTMAVTIRVTNPTEQPVKGVVVTDALPARFSYEWDSARVGSKTVPVMGINPYTFHIDETVEPRREVVLSYTAVAAE